MGKFVSGKASVLALFASMAMVGFLFSWSISTVSADRNDDDNNNNCGVQTYEFFNEGSNNDVSVSVHNSDEEIDASGLNGWSITNLWLAEHNHNYISFGSGNKHNFNPNNFGDIFKVKVEVTKVCPTATPRPTHTPTPTVTATPTPDNSDCDHDGDPTDPTEATECASPTPTATPIATPTIDPCIENENCATATPSATPAPTDNNNNGGNDGGDGLGCATHDCSTHPTTNSASQGQVLGTSTSTMGKTGSFDEMFYQAIMTVGATLSAFGVKGLKKARKVSKK